MARIKYSSKIATAICNHIINGMSVREIGRQDDMPSDTCIFNWLARNKGADENGEGGFIEQYTRAKEIQAEQMAEDILNIADNASNDYMERTNDEGKNIGWQLNGEHVQRSRLRIESRKWLMGKMKPKKYGDKMQHTGADGKGPISVVLNSADEDL